MELVDFGPNVVLREADDGQRIVVLGFPYDPHIVDAVRRIPGRRFDWDAREWFAPAEDWVGVHVADVLVRFPDLTTSEEADAWLRGLRDRWIGTVGTMRFDGRGWFVLRTRAGTVPAGIETVGHDDVLLAPLTAEAAAVLREQPSARLDPGANRCVTLLEIGVDPPAAQLEWYSGVEGEVLRLDVLWDPDVGAAFDGLKGADRRRVPLDPWLVDDLDAFLGLHDVEVTALARPKLAQLRAEHEAAMDAVRGSRATSGEP